MSKEHYQMQQLDQFHNKSASQNQSKHRMQCPSPQSSNTAFNSTHKRQFHTTTHSHLQVTSSYNQLFDQTLVQYFYPKKNKILKNAQKQNNNQNQANQQSFKRGCKDINKTGKEQRSKLNRMTERQKKYNFEIRKDRGTQANLNEYDVLSYKQSLRKVRIHPVFGNQPKSTTQNKQLSVQDLLKSRLQDLQTQVYNRIPCLKQMGVRFKRLKRAK